MTISKAQLISSIAGDTCTPKVQVEALLKSFTHYIAAALKDGEDVRIAGFGTFAAKKTAARTGRNPRTGAELKIDAKVKPVFKPASDFTASFN